MNSLLREVMDKSVPKFNTDVTNGIVKYSFERIPEYLDDVIRSSIKSLHPGIPLTYDGFRYIDPEIDFNLTYRKDVNQKIPFDLAHSDVYPVVFRFTYDGEPLERLMLLPYGREGNLMMISGTKYVIVPVLSDTVISPDNNQVFVRLLKDKLTFKSYTSNFLLNGNRAEGIIIWVEIIKNTVKTGDLGKPLNAISLHLLGEFGFYGTIDKYMRKNVQPLMKREFKLDDVIITTDPVDKYSENYNIFESTGIRPSRLKVQGNYVPHDIKICVHKDVPLTSFVYNFIYGTLESCNILPSDALEILNLIHSKHPSAVQDEIFKWRMMLGTIAYKGNYSVRKVAENIMMHFESVKYYIDSVIYRQLKDNNMDIKDFFDLIYEMLSNFVEWTRSANLYNGDIANQFLDVNYYVCYEIMIGFNKVIHAINKRKQKSRDPNRIIKYNEINKIFQEEWRHTKIYQIVKSASPNFNISSADYTGDLKYPKCTALVELQACGEGIKRPKDPRFPLQAKFLSGIDMVYGSCLSLPKNKPSPKFRINTYCQVKMSNGRIIVPKDLVKSVSFVDSRLKGRGDKKSYEDTIVLEGEAEENLK